MNKIRDAIWALSLSWNLRRRKSKRADSGSVNGRNAGTEGGLA